MSATGNGSQPAPPVRAIAAAAILAPSADNQLDLHFSERPGELLIWPAPSWHEAPAHRTLLRLMSLGAACENAERRAHALGYAAHTVMHLEGTGDQPIAEISLTPSTGRRPDDLNAAIEARHTNRRLLFRGPRLPPEQRAALTNLAEDGTGVRLVWLDAPDARRRALAIARIAETERFRVRELHAELFSSIRFDAGWTTTTEEGIAPGALEVEWLARTPFEWMADWDRMRLANCVGAAGLLGVRAAWLPCRLATHLCALTSSLDSYAGAVAAGRALQRIWLRVTTLGLAMQVLAAGAVLSWPENSLVSSRTRQALAGAWSALCRHERPMLLLRMGRARTPRVRSGRKPLDAYWRA
jgi:hypothetical protein